MTSGRRERRAWWRASPPNAATGSVTLLFGRRLPARCSCHSCPAFALARRRRCRCAAAPLAGPTSAACTSQLAKDEVREVALQGTLGSLPETGSAQERPVASAASLDKAGRQQSAEEAEKPSRSDSLPEASPSSQAAACPPGEREGSCEAEACVAVQVFKRLTSNRFASLGVRAAGDGGSPAATKPRNSPFKRHHPGHRVTLLGPSTGF